MIFILHKEAECEALVGSDHAMSSAWEEIVASSNVPARTLSVPFIVRVQRHKSKRGVISGPWPGKYSLISFCGFQPRKEITAILR